VEDVQWQVIFSEVLSSLGCYFLRPVVGLMLQLLTTMLMAMSQLIPLLLVMTLQE